MSNAKTLLIGFLLLFTMPTTGCKDREAGGGRGADGREITVFCIRCESADVLTIAGNPEDETWPRQCPSCNRTGAYPSANCPGCGKPVIMMDQRTSGYGSPESCPHCRRTWTNPR